MNSGGMNSGALGLDDLQGLLDYRFTRLELLDAALTHRSVGHTGLAGGKRAGRAGPAAGKRDGISAPVSYERLEFLGDRVLGLIVAEMLLERFPLEPEGDLARRHAELVRKETLAGVAMDLGLPALIRLPAIEEQAARSNPSLLADVCEAVIAALYLDGGFARARGFVRDRWTLRMEAALAPPKDPKTALQEWAQARGKNLPLYHLVRRAGPPHQPVFTVAVAVEGQPLIEASGASKRHAEAAAATELLDRIRREGAA